MWDLVLPYKCLHTQASKLCSQLVDDNLMVTNKGSLMNGPAFAAGATRVQHTRAVCARATPRARAQRADNREDANAGARAGFKRSPVALSPAATAVEISGRRVV